MPKALDSILIFVGCSAALGIGFYAYTVYNIRKLGENLANGKGTVDIQVNGFEVDPETGKLREMKEAAPKSVSTFIPGDGSSSIFNHKTSLINKIKFGNSATVAAAQDTWRRTLPKSQMPTIQTQRISKNLSVIPQIDAGLARQKYNDAKYGKPFDVNDAFK